MPLVTATRTSADADALLAGLLAAGWQVNVIPTGSGVAVRLTSGEFAAPTAAEALAAASAHINP